MGILSWFKGGDSSDLSNNPWRRLYDPGSAPNVAKTEGATYYDCVKDDHAPSVWDCVLKSEDFRRKSFDDIDTDHDGFIDQAELQQAVGPRGPDAAQLVKEADKEGKGRITRREFNAVMSGHFGTA